MSKNQIILTVLVVVMLLGGLVGLYFVLKPKEVTDSSASADFYKNQIKPTVTSQAALNYLDSAGFSLKYPSGFNVSDVTPDDDSTYSFLDITKGNEKITLKIEDTKYKSLADWEKDNTFATVVGATSLGGMSAKQYKMSSKLVTVAIDKAIIYYLEYSGSDEATYSLITDSFTLTDGQTANSGGGAADGAIYEEEEVVE